MRCELIKGLVFEGGLGGPLKFSTELNLIFFVQYVKARIVLTGVAPLVLVEARRGFLFNEGREVIPGYDLLQIEIVFVFINGLGPGCVQLGAWLLFTDERHLELLWCAASISVQKPVVRRVRVSSKRLNLAGVRGLGLEEMGVLAH